VALKLRAALVDSSAATSSSGTFTTRPPEPASSQVGSARPALALCTTCASKRTAAPLTPSACAKTWTWPRPISVTVPGATETTRSSPAWRPVPVRIQTSSW